MCFHLFVLLFLPLRYVTMNSIFQSLPIVHTWEGSNLSFRISINSVLSFCVHVYAELFLNIIEYGISSVCCCCLFGVSSCIVILKTREEEKHQHHENVCLSFSATHKKALKWTRNMSKDEQMGGKAYYTSNFLKVSHFGFHHQFFFLLMEMRRSLSRRNDGCCLHKTRIHKLWRKTFERGKLTLNKKRGKMRRDWGEIAE